jgi:hypothetical protein
MFLLHRDAILARWLFSTHARIVSQRSGQAPASLETKLASRPTWPLGAGRRGAAICRRPGSSNRRAEHRANRGRRYLAHSARSSGLKHDFVAVSDKKRQRRQSRARHIDLDLLAVGPDNAEQAAQDQASRSISCRVTTAQYSAR